MSWRQLRETSHNLPWFWLHCKGPINRPLCSLDTYGLLSIAVSKCQISSSLDSLTVELIAVCQSNGLFFQGPRNLE